MVLMIEKGCDVGGKARNFPKFIFFPFKRPLIWKAEKMYSTATCRKLPVFKGASTFAISKFFNVL